MSDVLWNQAWNIPLLQWFARGSLKQHLMPAIRLWVILHTLYGDRSVRLPLPDPFIYADWRDAFFSRTHPVSDAKPDIHDPACPCTKTTIAWLFSPSLTLTQAKWDTLYQSTAAQTALHKKVQHFEQSLNYHNACPENLSKLLHQRLFAVTRRTLASDLKELAKIHWLKASGRSYRRVSEPPSSPNGQGQASASLRPYDLAFLTQPDLAAIADNLSQDLNGQRRFFVHVDHVISEEQIDRVDHWQEELRSLWQYDPVPPLRIHYRAAGDTKSIPLIVYPVCIYYYRRGPYLCSFGQVPDADPLTANWRNLQLDRITEITPLCWTDAEIPPSLSHAYQTQTLPTPEEITCKMTDAWGFDYYKPAKTLLLRFDVEWNQRYIHNTPRHSTFQAIEPDQVEPLLRRELSGSQLQIMLKLWHQRSPQDAYYMAQYRHNDPNVHQQLRAWRPHVEVLLPWDLREQMIQEMEREWYFYHQT